MKALRPKAVADRLGIKLVTLKKWVAQGRFPKPIKLAERVAVWEDVDVENWLNAKKMEVHDGRSEGAT